MLNIKKNTFAKRAVRLSALSLAVGLCFLTVGAYAAGFQLYEQSGASLGDFNAGAAAIADDATTNWYNPAGLVRLHHAQLSLGGILISTTNDFTGSVTDNIPTPFGIVPITQTGSVDGGTFNFVPNIHLAVPLGHGVVGGLSVVTPFGLSTSYNKGSVAQSSATLSELKTVDVNANLAIPVTKKFSVAGGLNFVHAVVDLNNALPTNFAFPPFRVTGSTQFKNRATDDAFGWNIGLLYQFTKHTRVGFAYRSQVHLKLEGTSTFLPNSTLNAKASLTLPDYAGLSIYSRVSPRIALMGTVNYTGWDAFKNVILKNVAIPSGMTVTPQNYRNTFNVIAGLHYFLSKKIFLRFGLGFDKTPTNNKDRDLRLPDSNRIVVATGIHYQASKKLGLDLGYLHVFANQASINQTQQGTLVVTTRGKVDTSADLFGFQASYKMI